MKLRRLASAPLALGYWSGVLGARRRANGRARILRLHGVTRRQARAFERAMRYVRREFEVVPLDTLLRMAAQPDARFRRQLAITFDDGLRNNVEVAYPVLKRLGLPATFFVCPQLVDEGRWLWNHEARQRLRRLAEGARAGIAGELGCAGDVESIVARMKDLPLAEREHAESRIRAASRAFSPTAEERHAFDLAGWVELRGLDPRLVTLGSHTLTHPILTRLDPAALEREVAGSRRALEERIQRPAGLFAYPNGDLNDGVLDCVRRTYRAAVTVEEGQAAAGCDPHLLPRINVPGSLLRLVLALHRDHFLVTPSSASGSQVAIDGNATTTSNARTIMQKKGIEASAT